MNQNQSKALNYLKSHHVLSLATTSEEGIWAASLFYVNKNFLIYFLSASTTRHIRNIDKDNHVAATISEDHKEWATIKGIQLEGDVKKITTRDEIEEVKKLYSLKFQVIGQNAPSEINIALAKINWYVCVPSRMFFIDNSLGLGHRDEIAIT